MSFICKQEHHYEGVFFPPSLSHGTHHTFTQVYLASILYTKWFLTLQGTIVGPYPRDEWFKHSETGKFSLRIRILNREVTIRVLVFATNLSISTLFFSGFFYKLGKIKNQTRSSQRIE